MAYMKNPLDDAYAVRLVQGEGFDAQVRRRRRNSQREIVNPLSHLTEEELEEDLHLFHRLLPADVDIQDLRRAAYVSRDQRLYQEVAVGRIPEEAASSLPVQLTSEEKRELRREQESPFRYLHSPTISAPHGDIDRGLSNAARIGSGCPSWSSLSLLSFKVRTP